MGDSAVLDLVLRGAGETGCRAWVALWRGNVEHRLGPFAVTGSFDRLDGLAGRPEAYSRCLSEIIFADRALLDAFLRGLEALCEAGTDGQVPRQPVRLCLEPFNTPLQRLRWELLAIPGAGLPLAGRERLVFSRRVPPAWKPPDRFHPRPPARPEAEPPALPAGVRPCPQALFVAPNPAGLARLELAPIRPRAELERGGLGGVGVDRLPGRGQPAERCTLDRLGSRLQGGPDRWKVHPYDLLYLVCHARFDRGQPRLFFEDPYGGVVCVSGSELANRLDGICPRLVVLAPPLGSDPPAARALLALGPSLAHSVTGAVLALPGEPAPGLLPGFLQHFLAGLEAHGRPEAAAAEARRALLPTCPNWWQPVLFVNGKE
jgi:hypothetical protein